MVAEESVALWYLIRSNLTQCDMGNHDCIEVEEPQLFFSCAFRHYLFLLNTRIKTKKGILSHKTHYSCTTFLLILLFSFLFFHEPCFQYIYIKHFSYSLDIPDAGPTKVSQWNMGYMNSLSGREKTVPLHSMWCNPIKKNVKAPLTSKNVYRLLSKHMDWSIWSTLESHVLEAIKRHVIGFETKKTM